MFSEKITQASRAASSSIDNFVLFTKIAILQIKLSVLGHLPHALSRVAASEPPTDKMAHPPLFQQASVLSFEERIRAGMPIDLDDRDLFVGPERLRECVGVAIDNGTFAQCFAHECNMSRLSRFSLRETMGIVVHALTAPCPREALCAIMSIDGWKCLFGARNMKAWKQNDRKAFVEMYFEAVAKRDWRGAAEFVRFLSNESSIAVERGASHGQNRPFNLVRTAVLYVTRAVGKDTYSIFWRVLAMMLDAYPRGTFPKITLYDHTNVITDQMISMYMCAPPVTSDKAQQNRDTKLAIRGLTLLGWGSDTCPVCHAKDADRTVVPNPGGICPIFESVINAGHGGRCPDFFRVLRRQFPAVQHHLSTGTCPATKETPSLFVTPVRPIHLVENNEDTMKHLEECANTDVRNNVFMDVCDQDAFARTAPLALLVFVQKNKPIPPFRLYDVQNDAITVATKFLKACQSQGHTNYHLYLRLFPRLKYTTASNNVPRSMANLILSTPTITHLITQFASRNLQIPMQHVWSVFLVFGTLYSHPFLAIIKRLEPKPGTRYDTTLREHACRAILDLFVAFPDMGYDGGRWEFARLSQFTSLNVFAHMNKHPLLAPHFRQLLLPSITTSLRREISLRLGPQNRATLLAFAMVQNKQGNSQLRTLPPELVNMITSMFMTALMV
jgi:hypothetical protein